MGKTFITINHNINYPSNYWQSRKPLHLITAPQKCIIPFPQQFSVKFNKPHFLKPSWYHYHPIHTEGRLSASPNPAKSSEKPSVPSLSNWNNDRNDDNCKGEKRTYYYFRIIAVQHSVHGSNWSPLQPQPRPSIATKKLSVAWWSSIQPTSRRMHCPNSAFTGAPMTKALRQLMRKLLQLPIRIWTDEHMTTHIDPHINMSEAHPVDWIAYILSSLVHTYSISRISSLVPLFCCVLSLPQPSIHSSVPGGFSSVQLLLLPHIRLPESIKASGLLCYYYTTFLILV